MFKLNWSKTFTLGFYSFAFLICSCVTSRPQSEIYVDQCQLQWKALFDSNSKLASLKLAILDVIYKKNLDLEFCGDNKKNFYGFAELWIGPGGKPICISFSESIDSAITVKDYFRKHFLSLNLDELKEFQDSLSICIPLFFNENNCADE